MLAFHNGPSVASLQKGWLLFLDGVYIYRDNRPLRFQRFKAPNRDELEDLARLISQRVGSCLERQSLLEQYTESA